MENIGKVNGGNASTVSIEGKLMHAKVMQAMASVRRDHMHMYMYSEDATGHERERADMAAAAPEAEEHVRAEMAAAAPETEERVRAEMAAAACAGDDVADADAGAAANSPPNSDASCAAADGTASVVDDRALPATEEAGHEATESAAAAPKAAAPKAAAPKAARKPKLTREQAYWKGTAYAFFGATPAVEAARVLRQRRMARRKDPAYESKMRRPAESTSHA